MAIYLIHKDKLFIIKSAKSLSYKGKIVKKGLHRPFFLSIVGASGEKWVFVGIAD